MSLLGVGLAYVASGALLAIGWSVAKANTLREELAKLCVGRPRSHVAIGLVLGAIGGGLVIVALWPFWLYRGARAHRRR
ncbi:MAG: hypothetical protein ACHQQR_00770 [Gemmatimonadales bacterium]